MPEVKGTSTTGVHLSGVNPKHWSLPPTKLQNHSHLSWKVGTGARAPGKDIYLNVLFNTVGQLDKI